MSQISHLSDLNPEILKLPKWLQDEFNNRFLENPSVEYLALRAGDFIKIIEEEKWEAINKKNEEIRIKNEALKKEKKFKDILPQLQKWKQLYKEEFNIDIDIENIQIPEKQQGFNWLIIVHNSLKLNQIYDKLKEKFNCWKYRDNLDEIERIVARPCIRGKPDTEIYAVWVKDNVEADEEHQNKSANQIQEENINSITLEERLLLELFYWRNTKKHLDIKNWTLCAGSRDPVGSVPSVRWYRDIRKFYVGWSYDATSADACLRARQTISF